MICFIAYVIIIIYFCQRKNTKYAIIYIGKTDSYKENTDWSAGISETKGEIQIMEMKELDYFIAIAEEKSISKAAERLIYGPVQPQSVFKHIGK